MQVQFVSEPRTGAKVTLLSEGSVYTTETPAIVVEKDVSENYFKVTTEAGDQYEGQLVSTIKKQADTAPVEQFEVLEEKTQKWIPMDNTTSPKGKWTRLKGTDKENKRPLIVPLAKTKPSSLSKRAQIRESLRDMWYSTYGPPQTQTRYCPDHPGHQFYRISDRTFQCPIDGKVYSFIDGFKTEDGKVIPGGSLSEQTPDDPSFYANHPKYILTE